MQNMCIVFWHLHHAITSYICIMHLHRAFASGIFIRHLQQNNPPFWPQCYRQWLYRAPLCITLKIKVWVVAYLFFFLYIFMQLFSAYTIMFFKEENWNNFVQQKLKKPPSKVAQNSSNPLLFLTSLSSKMAQTEEFMLWNVAYWPTVYKTGFLTNK